MVLVVRCIRCGVGVVRRMLRLLVRWFRLRWCVGGVVSRRGWGIR